MSRFSGNMRNQTAYPYTTGFRNEPNNFGPHFAEHAQQYSSSPFGLPVPPGGDKYRNHPLAAWMPFFGANPKVYEKPAEFEYQRDVLNMPEGFKGQCDHIDMVLINQISNADMWPIREAMPWKSNNDSLTINWHVWKYEDHLLSRTPEQSVSRLLTQKYDQHSDTMVRFGIALLLEHGFMRTPQGVANYLANIQQIKNATLETLMLGAQEAILYVDRSAWLSNRQGGVRTKDDLIKAEQREMRFWGIVQKQGFAIALDDLKDEFQKVNGTSGNYLIVGQGVLKYVATMGVNSGVYPMGQTTRIPQKERVNGLTIREWRPARIGDGQRDLDVSKINAVIGGFVPVRMNHLVNVPPEEFQTQFMNVRTHDEQADDYFTIEYKALHHICGLFAFNPASGRPMGGSGFGGSYLADQRDDAWRRSTRPSRWMLTRSGHEFFEGCASWGDYMEQHGVLSKWIASFMAKKSSQQLRFLADIAKKPLPAISKPVVDQAGDGRFKLLYASGNATRDLMDELANLMSAGSGDTASEAPTEPYQEEPDLSAEEQAAEQEAAAAGGDESKDAPLDRLKTILAIEANNASGGQMVKIYSRLMLSVIRASAPENVDGINALLMTSGGIIPKINARAADRNGRLVSKLNADLNTLYRHRDAAGPMIPVAISPGATKVVAFRGLADAHYIGEAVGASASPMTRIASLVVKGDASSLTPQFVKEVKESKMRGSVQFTNPAQLAFSNIDLTATINSWIGTYNTGADEKAHARAVTNLLGTVGSNLWKDLSKPEYAGLSGRFGALERRRLGAQSDPAKDLLTHIRQSGELPQLPRQVIRGLVRVPQMDRKDYDSGVKEDPWYEQHEESLRAVYSRRGPHNPASTKGRFETQQNFIDIINALRDAANDFANEDEKQLATTLFLGDLYFASVIQIPLALQPALDDKNRLVAEIKAGLSRLLLLYRRVGHGIIDILASMHEDSLAVLAGSRPQRDEAPSSWDDLDDRALAMDEEVELEGDDSRYKPAQRAAQLPVDGSGRFTLLPDDVENLLYSIPITNPDIVFWSLENDCWPLIYFNVLAPSMEYVTSPMVLMGAYGAAGFTYHGQHSFELGDDATLKIHYGHFTLYARTIVVDDRRICVRNHTFVHEYVGGNDDTFWNALDAQDREDWRNGLHSKSRLVQPYYPDDAAANSAYRLNITGFEHPDVRGRSDKPVPSTAPITARLWSFRHSINPNVQKPYIEAMHDYQTVCYQSHYQGCKYIGKGQYDPWGQSFLDKGHWGQDNGYPGCGGVRNGKRMWFERPDFSALSMRSNVISSGTAAGIS